MRSSRGLLQKKERETKLKNIMSSTSSLSRQEKPKETIVVERNSKPLERVRVPVEKPLSKQIKKYEEEYEEDSEQHFQSQDDDLENDDLFDDVSEEEEEQKPVRKNTDKVDKSSKNTKQQSKPQPKKSPKKYTQQEEDDDDDKEEERVDEEESLLDSTRKKRSVAIVSKSVLSKLIHDAGLDGVSSDVYSFMIGEMQNYIREIINVVSEGSEDEELVIRESDLKFLGDKSKATGTLDIKSFERLYSGVADNLNTNAEFSSGAFKACCAHTEIQMVRFLKKAKELISCYNKKRLGSKDLECLKKLLDDSE